MKKNHRKRFAHKLALALGKSVSQIMRMPSSEFDDWVAYYDIDPFGTERDSIHTAQIVQVIASLFVKHPKPLKDFILNFMNDATDVDIEQKLRMIAAKQGN